MFDWIRRPLLYHLLLECNIDGKIYKAIKALYTDNTAQVRINASLETDWFQVPSGVCQGDPLSATLFNIFINGLVENLKLLNIGININEKVENLNIGININGKVISILLYADDIILLAKSEPELQSLLLALESWCKYWQLNVNISKTKIIHFRNIRKNCTKFKFVFNETELGIVDSYKYLVFYLHENLNFDYGASKLADVGSRVLGTLINKLKALKHVTFNTYTKLYSSNVCSILDYASEIWGFVEAKACNQIQNRAIRYFLGVHKFCPIPALNGDMCWSYCQDRRFICMLRFWNRLISLNDNRFLKFIKQTKLVL